MGQGSIRRFHLGKILVWIAWMWIDFVGVF